MKLAAGMFYFYISPALPFACLKLNKTLKRIKGNIMQEFHKLTWL